MGYVRTAAGFEVDFHTRAPGESEELIQVCAGFGTTDTLQRELRALQEAGREYPHARMRLLTLLHDQIPPSLPDGILAQPSYAWMLDGPSG